MRKRTIALVLALLGVAGCAVEEEGCYTNEDCGDGWICDTTTGACLPSEDYDADVAGSESSLPDTVDADVPSAADDAPMTDTDAAPEADTAADKDAALDADTVPVESDMASDMDVDLTDDTDEEDADMAVDDAPLVTDDSPATDADADIDTAPDETPDTDTGCNDCACADYCHGHGTCTTDYGYPSCECYTGYAGSWCQQCDYAWQDHDGDGTCEKDDCAHATAPVTGWLDCGDHGTCDDMSGMSAADCDCDTYWVDYSGGECNHCWASNPNDC